MAEFKDMLKYYRTSYGYSQRQLAKALKISSSAISMYELGQRQPDFETEELIADFFNTDLNTLRGLNYEPSPYDNINTDLLSTHRQLLESISKLNTENLASLELYVNFLLSSQTVDKP